MRRFDLKSLGFACLLFGSLAFTSCQQELLDSPNSGIANGSGSVSLELNALVGFDNKTKALEESKYSNFNDYKVQIWSGSSMKQEFLFKDRPSSIPLANGSYMLKAFYGNEHAASRDEFYVYGDKAFGVSGKQNETVSISCVPTCAKVKVDFDTKMETYFTDYKVVYDTKALKGSTTATWSKADKDPWYLKVEENGETVTAKITLTPKAEYETESATVVQTKLMKPNEGWTLKVAPEYKQGQLGLTITIDESTEDQTIDIIIPSNWK